MKINDWGLAVFNINGGSLNFLTVGYLTSQAVSLYFSKQSSLELSSVGIEGRLSTKGEIKQLGDKYGQAFDAELFTEDFKHIKVSFILRENARRDHKEGPRVYN